MVFKVPPNSSRFIIHSFKRKVHSSRWCLNRFCMIASDEVFDALKSCSLSDRLRLVGSLSLKTKAELFKPTLPQREICKVVKST